MIRTSINTENDRSASRQSIERRKRRPKKQVAFNDHLNTILSNNKKPIDLSPTNPTTKENNNDINKTHGIPENVTNQEKEIVKKKKTLEKDNGLVVESLGLSKSANENELAVVGKHLLKVLPPKPTLTSSSSDDNGLVESNDDNLKKTKDEEEPEIEMGNDMTKEKANEWVFSSAEVMEVFYDVTRFWSERSLTCMHNLWYRNWTMKTRLYKSTHYRQWKKYALNLDRLESRDKWKIRNHSRLYNYRLIEKVFQELLEAVKENDNNKKFYLLRTCLSRNIGNIQNPQLYQFCTVGTKHLISQFVDLVVYALESLKKNHSPVSLEVVTDVFFAILQTYGNSALFLEKGQGLRNTLYHFGVLKSLFQQNLFPRIICGSFDTCLLASITCTKNDEELDYFFKKKPHHFSSLLLMFKNKKKLTAANLEILENHLIKDIGTTTFQEAFSKTNRVLNIIIEDPVSKTPLFLLNYLTCPNTAIFTAIIATFYYNPNESHIRLYNRNTSGEYIPYDLQANKMEATLTRKKLSQSFNINQYFVSQSEQKLGQQVGTFFHDQSPKLSNMVAVEVKHRSNQAGLVHACLAFDKVIYTPTSDILLAPKLGFQSYSSSWQRDNVDIGDPDVHLGELITWEKITMLQNRYRIEKSLNDIFLYFQKKSGKTY